MYGKGNWPLIVMFCLYAVLAAAILHIFIDDFSLKHIRQIPIKLLSIGCLFVYVFARALLYCVPFPFAFFTVTFFCNQLPRVFMFAAWHFLGIFFLSAFLFPSASKHCINIFYCVLLLMLVAALAIAIYSSYEQGINRGKKNPEDFEEFIAIANTIYYFILSVWVTAYAIRLFILLRRGQTVRAIRSALIKFFIIFTCFAVIWWFRCIWNLFVCTENNTVDEDIVSFASDCTNLSIDNSKEHNWFDLCFHFLP